MNNLISVLYKKKSNFFLLKSKNLFIIQFLDFKIQAKPSIKNIEIYISKVLIILKGIIMKKYSFFLQKLHKNMFLK